MNSDTQEAILQFPVRSWLAKHTQVHSSDGEVIYSDCPFCLGKRKLGTYQYNRVSVCGRCKTKGHESWRGIASLPMLIKTLEGLEWRGAFALLHDLSGIPEPKFERSQDGPPKMPDGIFPLERLQPDERAVVMLKKRGLEHLIDEAFLCLTGKYTERIILPCYYLDSYLGFEAKATYPSQNPPSLYGPGMDGGHYVCTSSSWDPASGDVALTESRLDAETLRGVMNAVGCFGGFRAGQVQALLELGVERLFWFVDGDAWNQIPKGVERMGGFCDNYVVPMPPDEDPNSMGREGCARLIEQAVLVRDNLDIMGAGMAWGRGL